LTEDQTQRKKMRKKWREKWKIERVVWNQGDQMSMWKKLHKMWPSLFFAKINP
jgi:hypothetical protein